MPENRKSSAESLINETPLPSGSGAGLGAAENPQSATGGLDELRRMESELAAGKAAGASPAAGVSAPAADSPEGIKRRRKFKKVPPENTIRLTIRQYWRLRDWLARRALGLPSDYAGVFIMNNDAKLVEPLVEPVIACMDAYLPEEWIVFIEEKSPVLQLFIALFEAEQTFAGAVEAAARSKKETPAAAADDRPRMPSLNETTGRPGRPVA